MVSAVESVAHSATTFVKGVAASSHCMNQSAQLQSLMADPQLVQLLMTHLQLHQAGAVARAACIPPANTDHTLATVVDASQGHASMAIYMLVQC